MSLDILATVFTGAVGIVSAIVVNNRSKRKEFVTKSLYENYKSLTSFFSFS